MVSFHDAENIQNDERSERKFNRETYFSLARELGGRPTGRFLFRTGTFSILFAVLDRRIPYNTRITNTNRVLPSWTEHPTPRRAEFLFRFFSVLIRSGGGGRR